MRDADSGATTIHNLRRENFDRHAYVVAAVVARGILRVSSVRRRSDTAGIGKSHVDQRRTHQPVPLGTQAATRTPGAIDVGYADPSVQR